MSPIPEKIRRQLQSDPFMTMCIHETFGFDNAFCLGPVQYHHVFTYASRQIQETWAIVPLCKWHHEEYHARLDLSNNDVCRLVSLLRATPEDFQKYPKRNFKSILERLQEKLGSEITQRICNQFEANTIIGV